MNILCPFDLYSSLVSENMPAYQIYSNIEIWMNEIWRKGNWRFSQVILVHGITKKILINLLPKCKYILQTFYKQQNDHTNSTIGEKQLRFICKFVHFLHPKSWIELDMMFTRIEIKKESNSVELSTSLVLHQLSSSDYPFHQWITLQDQCIN